MAPPSHNLPTLNSTFFSHVSTTRYNLLKVIGRGAYGTVYSALDSHTHHKVAIKHIRKALHSIPMSIRVLRELKLNRLLLHHPNIIQIQDILLPSRLASFSDTFVVYERMQMNLSQLLRKTPLTPLQVKYIMFQILRAVYYMHAMGVFHRDLKPSNVLINADVDIRICDFGLSRVSFAAGEDTLLWTDYIATRWYRAPELILEETAPYTTAIDMWSVGCILAELLSGGQVLFRGQSAAAQLELIVNTVGAPSRESIECVQNPRSRRMLQRLSGDQGGTRLQDLFPTADPLAVDLLNSILSFDPEQRPSALDALRHMYFAEYRHLGIGANPGRISPQEFEFEHKVLNSEFMREELVREIERYHPGETGIATEWGNGQYRALSAVDRAAEQTKGLKNGQKIKSTTLQEGVLEAAAGGVAVDGGNVRFATMSEAELAKFTDGQ